MSFILIFRRIIRHACAWLALATLLCMGGCSTLQLVYTQSDTLIYWWVDGYADLQDHQKQFTRDALTDLHRWHRQQQLPEYIALLKRMQTMAPNDITSSQVCAVAEDMKTSVVTLLRFVEPATTHLASQLKPEQWRSIRQRFDKTNKDWRADWLDPSPQDRLRYRTKQATQRLEDFYGRLQAPQREVLHKWLSSSVFDPVMSYAERERRQADMLETLQGIQQEGSVTTQTQTRMRGLMERNFSSPNERYRAYNLELWSENCVGFAKLHNSTTLAQRRHMVDTLHNYESDLITLMAQK